MIVQADLTRAVWHDAGLPEAADEVGAVVALVGT